MNRWNTPDGRRPSFQEFDIVWDVRTNRPLLLRLCAACRKGLFLPWTAAACAKNSVELRCKQCQAAPRENP